MRTQTFRGLNNVTDPMRLGLDWFVQADNVHITDTGGVARRGGYNRTLSGAITAAFSTPDFARMYIVDAGALKAMTGPTTTITLRTGLTSAPVHWAEVNDQVFFNNGVDSGIITADNNVLDWRWPVPDAPALSAVTGNLAAGLYQVRCTYTLADGRMTGASDSAAIVLTEGQALQITSIPQFAGATTNVFIAPADFEVYQHAGQVVGTAMVWNSGPDDLGADLLTTFNDPLPLGADIIQIWRGRAYAAQYLPTEDVTAVWISQPLGFHLFDLAASYVLIKGRVLMMAPHEEALLIGSDQLVWSYDGKMLKELCEYGVVPGWHWADDEGRTLFWTTRGLCSALPFKNLTEAQVSVAPGVSAGGTVIRDGGQKRYVVALKRGGDAFNTYP
jgi:hypothetical protein